MLISMADMCDYCDISLAIFVTFENMHIERLCVCNLWWMCKTWNEPGTQLLGMCQLLFMHFKFVLIHKGAGSALVQLNRQIFCLCWPSVCLYISHSSVSRCLLQYTWSRDTRDNHVLPNTGYLLKVTNVTGPLCY